MAHVKGLSFVKKYPAALRDGVPYGVMEYWSVGVLKKNLSHNNERLQLLQFSFFFPDT